MRYVGPRQIVIDDKPVLPEFWTPQRVVEGATVLIIGSGPSLASLDLDVVRGHRFIVVNSGCRRLRKIATENDILYFTDNAWNENRPELAKDWPGPVVTPNRNAKIRLGGAVHYLDVVALTAWARTLPDNVQSSSGHIAAVLAAFMGAARLVLYGFECAEVGGRTHGHGDYTTHDLGVFTRRFLPAWLGLTHVFNRIGVEVINATPGGALECFPRMGLAEALN